MTTNTQNIIDSALEPLEDSTVEDQPKPKKRKRDVEPELIEEEYDGSDILSMCNMDEKKRFLIRQIHALRNSNPEAYDRTLRFGEDPLSGLSESQLRTILCVLKEECGISGPYDNAQSIASFFGNLVERNFGLQGLTQILSTDSDIITLIHEYLPRKFQNFGGVAKLADKILEIISAVYSQQKGIKKPWIDVKSKVGVDINTTSPEKPKDVEQPIQNKK